MMSLRMLTVVCFVSGQGLDFVVVDHVDAVDDIVDSDGRAVGAPVAKMV